MHKYLAYFFFVAFKNEIDGTFRQKKNTNNEKKRTIQRGIRKKNVEEVLFSANIYLICSET